MKKLFLILLVATFANYVTASCILADTIHLFSAKQYQLKTNELMEGGNGEATLPASIDMTKAGISSVPVTAKCNSRQTGSDVNTENSAFTTGIAAIIMGEPLFVVSSKNKKRVLSVSTTEQVIKKMQRNSISRVSIPSIKLTVHL
jgi:hypothetical protein